MFLSLAFCDIPGEIDLSDRSPCQLYTSGGPTCNSADYSYYPKSIIPACPTEAFQTSSPLKQWLLNELFCIKTDNRWFIPVKSGPTYSKSTTSNKNLFKSTESETKYSYRSSYEYRMPVVDNNGEIFRPYGAGSVASCNFGLPIRFLVQETPKSCSFNSETDLPILAYFTAISIRKSPNSTDVITPVITGVTDPAAYIGSAFFNFQYSMQLEITALSIHLVESPSGTEFTRSVAFSKEGSTLLPQSGEYGYQIGCPLRAANKQGSLISFDNTTLYGSFPIVVGPKCDANIFTPLIFGKDTVSGCKGNITSLISTYKRYNAIGKYGISSPENANDWVSITDLATVDNIDSCKSFSYTIGIDKMNTTSNYLNRVYGVKLECLDISSSTSNDDFTISVSFVYPYQQTNLKIGEFPVSLPVLPEDFFYPFK